MEYSYSSKQKMINSNCGLITIQHSDAMQDRETNFDYGWHLWCDGIYAGLFIFWGSAKLTAEKKLFVRR